MKDTHIAAFIIGVLLCLFFWREVDHGRKTSRLQDKLTTCDEMYRGLLAARTHTDTVVDYREVKVPQIVYIKARDSFNDTVYISDEYVRTYTDTTDTDDVTIYNSCITKGKLLSKDLSYVLKVPKTITKQHIVYRDAPREVKVEQNWHIMAGASVGVVKPQFTAGATVVYKRTGASYTYDMTHRNHLVGVVYKFH